MQYIMLYNNLSNIKKKNLLKLGHDKLLKSNLKKKKKPKTEKFIAPITIDVNSRLAYG